VADRTPIIYATSRDGVQWTRPNLGVIEFQDSKDNIIVLQNYGYHDLYSPSVIKDNAYPGPERRYKMIWWDFPLGSTGYQDDGMCVAHSPDGIQLSKYGGNPVLHAKKNDCSSFTKDGIAQSFHWRNHSELPKSVNNMPQKTITILITNQERLC
jgi:hypothetical protein